MIASEDQAGIQVKWSGSKGVSVPLRASSGCESACISLRAGS